MRKSQVSVRGGVLQGIRIVDMTRLYPGPLATMIMGDLGADVIKLEDTNNPDYIRFYPPFIQDQSAFYLAVNRSKRSLMCDLRTDPGREIFFRLVKTADVVVEQFRPTVMEKMGLSYERACLHKPDIIYISITGYGQSGPYAEDAGHDLNYTGYAGILDTTGTRESGPIIPSVQMADVAGGSYMAVIATLAALWNRVRTGKGEHVDVSMLDGVLPLMTLEMAHFWAGEPVQRGAMPLSGSIPRYGVYECADGKWVALAALEDKFWKNFCDVVAKPQWLELDDTPENRASLRGELQILFKTRSREEWLKLSAGKNVCLTPLLSPAEMQSDPHLIARNMIVEQSHPHYGKIRAMGIPLKFAQTSHTPSNPPPVVGEHTREILQQLGYLPRQIEELQQKGIIEIG